MALYVGYKGKGRAMAQENRIPIQVVCGPDSRQIHVQAGENLLMALVKAGFPVEFMCTTGKCTTCRSKLDAPNGSANQASETERYRLGEQLVREGYRLTCQLYVTGPLTVYLD